MATRSKSSNYSAKVGSSPNWPGFARVEQSHWQPWVKAALDLLFPPCCWGCRTPFPNGANNEVFCETCQLRVWKCEPPACQRCGEPFPTETEAPLICGTCREVDFAFDFAVAPFQSRGAIRDLVHRFKYQREFALRRPLARLFETVFEDDRLQSYPDPVLVPVPLHPRREREREFNQSFELAKPLAKRFGITCLPCLKRQRYTGSQTHHGRRERRKNLRGAFLFQSKFHSEIKNRSVFLIDDVFTTGSTANECSAVLRYEGEAKNVVVLTLARG